MMMNSFYDPVVYARWMRNQGQTTLDSFEEHHCDLEKQLRWFYEMCPYYENEDAIFVHAGLVHEKPEENSMHDLIWDREMAHGRQYDGKLVIFGHTETEEVTYRSPDDTKLQMLPGEIYELPKQGCINMDTGCVYGQKLSALVIENGTIRVYQESHGEHIL